MGLSIALSNALSGLNVNQQQLSVLSQNISNANTQGYSKQIAQQESVFLKGEGQGVSISEVVRKIDEYLAKSVQRQGSLVASSEVINDYSTRVQLLMGNPGNKNSIDSYINTFYNTVQSLSQSPQNTTLQQTAVNAAVSLADQISGLSNSLRDLQSQADQDIAKGVTEVNTSLKRLSDLNMLINSNVSLGKSISDLEDQRDKTIREISQYINVSTFQQLNGNISATTGNGVTILDNSPYQLEYTPAASAVTFSDGSALNAITVSRLGTDGQKVGVPIILASSDIPANIASVFSSGKLSGLMQMRDKQLPDIIAQLDNLAANMRDQFNEIHNAGSGYPGADELTGNRPVYAGQVNQWSGMTRIAVLDSNGQPVASPYADEPFGFTPLTINLEKLDSGSGVGNPSVQSIIDTINQYYGVPQPKVELGNLNNIQLTSNTTSIPATPPKLNFDFNLSNISGKQADFFVTNVSVTNNVGTLLTPVTSTLPRVDLAGLGTYTTTPGSNTVTVAAATAHGLYEGQTVYLSTPPGGPYDGIPASALGGYFTITNVNATSFQIKTSTFALSGAQHDVAAQSVQPNYARAESGIETRTRSNGSITADLTADPASPFYNVSVTVGVDDGTGNIKTSVVTYQINNQQPNILNKFFAAKAIQGSGSLVMPQNNNAVAKAIMVDENGVELPKLNGAYTNDVPGFLKIVTIAPNTTLAIDSATSKELGNPTVSPIIPGTNRGFSHYFGLNDFFDSNNPTNTGDTRAGSALGFAVQDRFRDNPGLLSLGQMIKSPNSIKAGDPPNYTYQLNPGDNNIITKLSGLSSTLVGFATAGGIGATSQSFAGYAGQIVGSAATNALTSRSNNTNANALLDGYNENASAISGVNLDVELANTVIYQNAYAASARVITVANQMFDLLLNAFQG